MKFPILFICLTLVPIIAFGHTHNKLNLKNDPQLKHSLDSLNSAIDYKLIEKIVQDLLEEIQAINSTCVEDLEFIASLFKDKKQAVTAIKFLDAQFKPPAGILNGALNWLGSYEECKAFTINVTNDRDLQGQYCTVNLNITTAKLDLNLGVCAPASCHLNQLDPNSVQEFIQRALIKNNIPLPKGILDTFFKVESITCVPLERPKLDAGAIFVVFLICVFSFFVLFGTFLDFYARQKQASDTDSNEESNIKNEIDINNSKEILIEKQFVYAKPLDYIMRSFSLLRHIPKILDISVAPGSLGCLHGIRFLSMAWVIIGHGLAFSIGDIDNIGPFAKSLDNFFSNIILRATVSVDTFFLLSGLLLTYLFMKQAAQNPKINWIMFYVHRYFRLTPTYMILLAIYAAVFKFTGTGPVWPQTIGDAENCKTTWWWNLIYISNFADAKMCMGWSWYLANDMQFYVISPLFLIPLTWKPWISFIIIGVLTLASWIANGIIAYHYNLVPLFANFHELILDDQAAYMARQNSYMMHIYTKPYTRITPYLVGVVAGYLIYRALHVKQAKLNKWQVALGWALGLVCLLIPIFGIYHVHLERVSGMFFIIFHRTCWAVGLAWVIYACLTGYGGYINDFLSLNLLMPLSRLTYCAYLIHPMVIYSFYFGLYKYFSMSIPFFLILSFGFMVVSYMLAFLATLAFESPIMAFEKILLSKKKS